MAKTSVNIDERTWDHIQDAYENSDEPVRTICARYGITQRTLYARMNAENWKRRHGQSGDKDTKAIAQLRGIVTRRVALLRLAEKKGRGVKTVALIDNISALVKLLERIETLEKKRGEAHQREPEQPRVIDDARRLEIARRLEGIKRQFEYEAEMKKRQQESAAAG